MMIPHILRRSFFVFVKILLGCLLGCSIVLFFASKSEIVHQEIKNTVRNMFYHQFNCNWDGEIESIDLLSLHIKFRHAHLIPCNPAEEWSLYTEKFHVSASWFDFFWRRKFLCHGYFEKVVVYEEFVDSSSQFWQLLVKMSANGLPAAFSFDLITIKQGQMIMQDSTNNLHGSYEYNCQMSRESDGMHTKLYILDAWCHYKDIPVFENMFGNFISVIPSNGDVAEIYARIDCRLTIPSLQEKGACFLIGDVYRNAGAFVVSNEDQSFIIEPLKFRFKKTTTPMICSITLASDLIQKVIFKDVVAPDVSGDVTMTITGNLLDLASTLQGQIQAHNISYKHNKLVDQVILKVIKEKNGYTSQCFLNKEIILEGSVVPKNDFWQFDIINNVEFVPWGLEYWKTVPTKSVLSGHISTSYEVDGSYNFPLINNKLDEQATLEGDFAINMDRCKITGSFLDKQFESIMHFNPLLHLDKLCCWTKDEVLFDFHQQQDEETVGFVNFVCIKDLLSDQYKSSFSQPGKINMSGRLEKGIYFADVLTKNAHIRIPSFYNVIQSFQATTQFDIVDKSVVINDLVADLYEGSIRCDHAMSSFDGQTKISFIHAPLFLQKVLLSWHKGIVGVVSGRLFLSLRDNQPLTLQGNVIFDKAQLKGNVFSTEFQEHLFGQSTNSEPFEGDCNLDIFVETKEPVIIETSFLQAKAHLDLKISNTMKRPEVEGVINLVSGELKFPYKSLFISHGQVLIMPKKSSEPMIDFVAKGKIKRYNITMRATGTMIDQQIHFESSPYLTEEQIISLLLVGSQDSSLSVVMPAMFMQKLHEIVFGPAISKSKLDVIFNRLLQSFKNVRIYPQFTNQTGRGGVRGVVEIDATDRLHGRIDSNLMQLEDTIFEADYELTDDVMVRAIKDGPSTYGGEVEMRWKFS